MLVDDNSNNKMHLPFEKRKFDILLKDLSSELNLLLISATLKSSSQFYDNPFYFRKRSSYQVVK